MRWLRRSDTQTKPIRVKPGDVVTASIGYNRDNSYTMNMTSKETGQHSNFRYPLMARQSATESVGYFVLEHQPEHCAQFPPNGLVRWTDVAVEVDGKVVSEPIWTAVQERPACNSTAVVLDPKTIEIRWDASAPDV